MALTEKQKLFVQEYLIDFNAAAAARRVGYSDKTAKENGYLLLHKPAVQAALAEAVAARIERTQVTQDWVIKRLQAIADMDISRVCQWDEGGVRFLDSDSLSWEAKYPIDAVTVDETIKEEPGGEELILKRKKKVYIANAKAKTTALELLGRHLGMFSDKPLTQNAEAIGFVGLPDVDTDSI